MSNIDEARAAAVLAGMLGVSAMPASAVSPLWVRLITASGVTAASWATAAGPAGSAGTGELSASGYTAGGASGYFGAVATGIPPTSQGPTAAAGISWTAGAAWTIQGFELWDNAATQLRWWFGTFTGGTVTVNSGQVLQIAQNAITTTLG